VNAPPVPEDPSGEIHAVTHNDGVVPERKSPILELSDYQIQTEAVLCAYIAVEHGRVRGVFDARESARYAAAVADTSRLLAGRSAKLHLGLMRHMVRWLRSLPASGWVFSKGVRQITKINNRSTLERQLCPSRDPDRLRSTRSQECNAWPHGRPTRATALRGPMRGQRLALVTGECAS
jgi:hypothetical protein